MATETWKPVQGYEGLYEVSDMGRVRSIGRIVKRGNNQLPIRERLLTLHKNKVTQRHPNTRRFAELWKDGKRKRVPVARLVCMAFVDNPENKPHVNHIDGNTENDKAINLEWVTPKENNMHALKNGLVSRDGLKKRVRGVHYETGEVLEFESLTMAAAYLGVAKNAINAGIHGYGRAKRCRGYKWGYVD